MSWGGWWVGFFFLLKFKKNILTQQPSPSSTPGSMSSNFRLNANARPFVAPVSPPPQDKSEKASPTAGGSVSLEQVSLHPALLFGGLED